MKILSSGLQDASAVISAKPCYLWGFSLVTDDSKDVLMTLWDSETSTTTNDVVVGYAKCSDESLTVHEMFPYPVYCAKGLYAALDAAEGDYIIYYSLK